MPFEFFENELISAVNLRRAAPQASPAYVSRQLNKLLRKNDGALALEVSESLYDFLMHVDPKAIGFIKLRAAKRDGHELNSWLFIDIYLDEGIVTLRSFWNAAEMKHAECLVYDALRPIAESGLAPVTGVDFGNGNIKSFSPEADEYDIDSVIRILEPSHSYDLGKLHQLIMHG